jgi:hypothetical protein
MQMLCWRNNIEACHTPSLGLFSLYYYPQRFLHVQNLAPFFLTGSSVIININNKKNLVYEPRTWKNLGAVFLPGLTTPRHENGKIQQANELLKAIEPTPDL